MNTGPAELQALLEARARELAAPRAEAEVARPEQLVLRAGSLRCALPTHRVREVLGPGPVAGLPRRGHALVGLRATRRGAVPVADLCRLAGEAPLDPDRSHVVVLDADEPLGLLADDAQVLEEPEHVGTPAPAEVRLPGSVRVDGVVALDVDALLADARLRAARSPTSAEPDPRRPEGAPWTSP